MKELIIKIEEEVKAAFAEAGYDENAGRVSISNRPDLCEYQCNGAMGLAKSLKKNPLEIANAVADRLSGNSMFEKCEAIAPGFINIDISPKALCEYLTQMDEESHLSLPQDPDRHLFMDYGGPNVAKPLHVGHLRSAIIGESIKRIYRALGVRVTADVHLGDWGQQMGLIINELHTRYGEDFATHRFSLSELEEVYPVASAKSKEDEAYKKDAMAYTRALQNGDPVLCEILSRILELSISDLKINYERLHVDFDLWKGESDAAPYITDMVEKMKSDGFAYISEDALVVDVAEEGDSKEVPPCMILKSDGAALYNTTDLATLVWRMKDYDPDEVIYIVDKRQSLYFTQVFRCAKKTGIVPAEKELTFLGFGTMNGPDKKPFKTRQGGVMRLSTLLDEVKEACLEKITENEAIEPSERESTAEKIALAAIKYGDLSNAPAKDYVFDVGRFISFEGNTGPYILYTMVRIKSILRKFAEAGGDLDAGSIPELSAGHGKDLLLLISRFNSSIIAAAKEYAPNRVCAYIYELSNAFNSFYHETKILSEEDEKLKQNYIKLLSLTLRILTACTDMLGFDAPERM